MQRKWLIKIGASILALSLVAACGTDDQEDPVGEDEAPLNQEEDNPDMNGENQDDPQLDNDGNGTNEDGTDANQDGNGNGDNGMNQDQNGDTNTNETENNGVNEEDNMLDDEDNN